MKPCSPFLMLALILLISLSCYVPERSYPGLSISMVTPHTSTFIWPLGEAMSVEAAAAIEHGGASEISFFASGRDIGSAPVDISDDKPRGSIFWTPPAAGEYFVQAQIYPFSGASAMSSPVRVCVLDIGASPTDSITLWGYGYSGSCAIPPAPPVPAGTSDSVDIHATISPASLGYDSLDCPSPVPPARITFNATVDDPSGRAAFVTVHLYAEGGGTSPFGDALFLTQVGGGTTGTRTFSGSTDDLSFSLNDALGGAPGTLTWAARALDRTGHIIAMDGPHDMLVGPCESPVHPLTIASPTPTLITIIPSTTPASAKDCPPGTYFAEQTHRCIAVQILPTKSGGGNPNCSQYKTDTACNAAPGCYYDYVAKKCK
jgi:hypothetical protein